MCNTLSQAYPLPTLDCTKHMHRYFFAVFTNAKYKQRYNEPKSNAHAPAP